MRCMLLPHGYANQLLLQSSINAATANQQVINGRTAGRFCNMSDIFSLAADWQLLIPGLGAVVVVLLPTGQ